MLSRPIGGRIAKGRLYVRPLKNLGRGGWIWIRFQRQDLTGLQPEEREVDDLQGHIIIAGFGRVGQMVSQLLSERLIQFVALDVRSERVQAGKKTGEQKTTR